jgi:hypothetical protein
MHPAETIDFTGVSAHAVILTTQMHFLILQRLLYFSFVHSAPETGYFTGKNIFLHSMIFVRFF